MKKVVIVVGTRPNFIKVTQFKKVASVLGDIAIKIIHTGQHFDEKMSMVFFRQFGLEPDEMISLESTTATSQIAEIMMKLEIFFKSDMPDIVMAVGDVNSTLAAALVANKMQIKLAHLESGLRSYDRTMPEEFNRLVTDQLSDYFFVTEESGMQNLLQEGVNTEKLFFVGNTMIDTMLAYEKEIEESSILFDLGLEPRGYILMTMHRPATVDHPVGLTKLIELLSVLGERKKIVFPIHPRTLKNISNFGLKEKLDAVKGVKLVDPLDYFSFQKLVKDSFMVLTDSGGIQEESTQRGIPCLTLRPNTERPVTIEVGTNTLIPFDLTVIMSYYDEIEKDMYKKGRIPDLWDGIATYRIIKNLISL